MKKENTNYATQYLNDSDIGYFDNEFVEEIRKEIKETLVSIKKEVDCLVCDVEYHDKKAIFFCNTCGREFNT